MTQTLAEYRTQQHALKAAKCSRVSRAAAMAPYDQFVLFGDSITQQSCNQDRGFAFMPAVQDVFIRRLDIINRGFSGYNTSQALVAFPEFIPKPEQATVRFLAIFFGANDACLPNSPTGQHVPLKQYAANLRKLIRMARDALPGVRIILISPPPVNEYQLEAANVVKYGTTEPTRTAEHTKLYADTCRDVRAELGQDDDDEIVLVDIWSAMMATAGWKPGKPLVGSKDVPENAFLHHWLSDGLHFLPAGYKFLFDRVMEAIKMKWPEQLPPELPFVLSGWEEAPNA